MSTKSSSDRRDQSRVCFRTPLTIVTLDRNAHDIRPILTEAWTEDVSLSGAQVVTKVPVTEGKVWMRFKLPGSDEQLLDAKIVRRTTREIGHFRKFNEPLNVYGIKFFRIIQESSVIEWLLATIRGERPVSVPLQVQKQFEELAAVNSPE